MLLTGWLAGRLPDNLPLHPVLHDVLRNLAAAGPGCLTGIQPRMRPPGVEILCSDDSLTFIVCLHTIVTAIAADASRYHGIADTIVQ